MTWTALRTPHAGTVDITLRAALALTATGLSCRNHIDNRSNHRVDAVSFPIFADLRAPGNGAKLNAESWAYGGMDTTPLLPTFPDGVGYWGVDNPGNLAVVDTESPTRVLWETALETGP